MTSPILQLQGVHKRFGGVHALRGVDFDLRPGEIHALLGENGAGKSTLIKVLSGVYQPDEGTLEIDNRPTPLANPRRAQALGIATIYQETSLYPDLSVLENLYMGRQPLKPGLLGLRRVDWARMRREATALFERLGLDLPLDARLGDLGKARSQLVEIAKALSQDARILILDEPTATLTQKDVDQLFAVCRGLKARGVAMVYISHRLEEIVSLCDRVTVLRDGAAVGSAQVSEVDQRWLVQKMVGRVADHLYPRTLRQRGKPLLELRGVSRDGAVNDVSLTVHEGEIVGMAGLVGSGRTEVARLIFGIDTPDAGEILVDGQPIDTRRHNPRSAMAAGLAMLPEDRGRQGLVHGFSIAQNLFLPLQRLTDRLKPRDEAATAAEYIKTLQIHPALPDYAVENLSGGNAQKVVIGKWLATQPRVLILDEPTQGVDVGAKAEIHAVIDRLVNQGMGILLISSELLEVLGMADRLLVMHQGRIVREFPRGAGQEAVMEAAMGLSSAPPEATPEPAPASESVTRFDASPRLAAG